MSASKKYKGQCHCGKVTFEVEMDLGAAVECNCSICSKRGALLAFVPSEKFKLLQGKDNLTDYTFNKRKIHHYFCKDCGILGFAGGTLPDGKPMNAINIRCLDGVDLAMVKIKHFDGKSL